MVFVEQMNNTSSTSPFKIRGARESLGWPLHTGIQEHRAEMLNTPGKYGFILFLRDTSDIYLLDNQTKPSSATTHQNLTNTTQKYAFSLISTTILSLQTKLCQYSRLQSISALVEYGIFA